MVCAIFPRCVWLCLRGFAFKEIELCVLLPVAPRWESCSPVYLACRTKFNSSRLSGADVVGLSLVVVLGTWILASCILSDDSSGWFLVSNPLVRAGYIAEQSYAVVL